MRVVLQKIKIPVIVGISLIILFGIIYLFSGNHHPSNDTEIHTESNVIALDQDAIKMADIQITVLTAQKLAHIIPAPGEIIPNANLTSKVTTRVPAQVIERYIQEGEHVHEGQPLVRLSSVDMAKTQGDLLLASQEWKRVQMLGKDAISAKRYAEAQVAYQHAYSTALAYGMTESEITELLRTQKPSGAKGEFKLLAPRSGTIFNINFTDGELVEIGRVLLQVVEEASVWVDVKIPPELLQNIKVGDPALVYTNNHEFEATVIQVHHQLNETTRTRTIRLNVPNPQDYLHPGQYVNCKIKSGYTKPVLALPVDAILKTPDGKYAVYVEKQPGHFQQVEVKMGEIIDNQAIVEGLAAGAKVVTKGSFFIHAELNKKGFHSHTH